MKQNKRTVPDLCPPLLERVHIVDGAGPFGVNDGVTKISFDDASVELYTEGY